MEVSRFFLATIAATAMAGCRGSTPTADIFTGSPRPPASTPGAPGERMLSTSLCVTNSGTPSPYGDLQIIHAVQTAERELAAVRATSDAKSAQEGMPPVGTALPSAEMLATVEAGGGDVVVYQWMNGVTLLGNPLATNVSPQEILGPGTTACIELYTSN